MPRLRVPIGSDGPVIDLSIWVGRVVAHALMAQGQAVAPAQSIRALIDTGADRTAIHPSALSLISSPPAGTIRVRRPGSTVASQWVNLHDLRLAFGSISTASSRRAWVVIEAAAVIPADPHVLALIGRDMLAHCKFIYDGTNGQLVLAY
jgi:predicted aspartyl protease